MMKQPLEEFLYEECDEERGYADSTLEAFETIYEAYSTWAEQNDVNVEDTTPRDVEEFVEWAKGRINLSYSDIYKHVEPAIVKFLDEERDDFNEEYFDPNVDKSLLVQGAAQHLNRIRGNLEQSTATNHTTGLIHYSEWLDQEEDLDPEDVTPLQIEDYLLYLKKQGYPNGTLSNKFVAVSKYYSFMVDKKKLWDTDPTEEAESQNIIDYKNRVKSKDRVKPKNHYLSEDEKDQLVEHCPAPRFRNKLIIKLMWQTGLRAGEVCNLKEEYFDWGKNSIWIPEHSSKSDEGRHVYFEDSLKTMLDIWYNGGERDSSPYASQSDYFFLSHQAEQLQPTRLSAIVSEAAENAGIQKESIVDVNGVSRNTISSHQLRHGYAVYMLKNGLDLKTLSEFMGHEDLNTTAEYLRYTKEDERIEYRDARAD
jgi:integrase/recombinase XerD